MALVLAAGTAWGTPHEFEAAALSWVRADDAASCPSGPDMARAVDARLGGGALVDVASAALVVEASIRARGGGGFLVDIALARGDEIVGRRELESADADCEPIAEQAALVIALTIDPEASPLPAPIDRSSPPKVTKAPAPARAVAAPPVPAPAPPVVAPPAWSGELEAATGLAAGTVPEVSLGIFVRGRARPPRFVATFELEGGYFFPKSLELAPGRGASFESFFVGVGLCTNAPHGARLYGSLCGGPEVVAVAGHGYGFDLTPHFMSFSAALSARGRLGVRPARAFSVVLGPDLVVPLGRDRFQTVTPTRTDQLFRMTPVGVAFELGGVGTF